MLRVPKFEFEDLRFGELGADTMISPRIAPAMIGLGLLEAVPEQAILQIAATAAAEHARQAELRVGLRERAEERSAASAGKRISRACASRPPLRFSATSARPARSSPKKIAPRAQQQCLNVPSASKCGGQGGCSGNYRPEVVPSRLTNITLYLQTLAVPARRNVSDAEVKRGELVRASAMQCVPRAGAQYG